jgi:hypothetical protein
MNAPTFLPSWFCAEQTSGPILSAMKTNEDTPFLAVLPGLRKQFQLFHNQLPFCGTG